MLFKRLTEAFQPAGRPVIAPQPPRQIADPLVTERDHMLGDRRHGIGVGESDLGGLPPVLPPGPGDDEGDAALLQHPPGGGRMLVADQHQGVDAASEKLADLHLLDFHRVFGACDHQKIAGVAEPSLQLPEKAAEKNGVDAREHRADHARTGRGQRPGHSVRNIAQRLDRGFHLGTLVGADQIGLIQKARDGSG